MRIDAHVHYLPPHVQNDLPLWAEREPYWHMLLNPPQGKSIQGYATAVQLIDDMDKAGLDQVLLVGEYFHQHDSCVTRNTAVLDLLQRYPDRLLALAAIQPTAEAKALAELRRCLAGGMVGVGELNPYAQNFQLASPAFRRLAEACIDANVPINLHVSEEIGPYYLGKSATPLRDYYDTAVAFPHLKLILAHWGGGLLFYEQMPRVRRQLAHVYYDTAASPLLYPTAQIFATALACVPPHKILYGSDYPLLIYPRRMTQPDFRPFLAEIDALNLPPEIYRAIMGENSQRLFNEQGTMSNEQKASPIHHSPFTIHHSPFTIHTLTTAYPETREILARYGLTNWASWEPLGQAAAAQGLSHTAVETLLAELQTEIAKIELQG